MVIQDIISALQEIAPLRLAAKWDNVGLLLGDPTTSVERMMTCLTVTPDSAAEAIAERAQLIVSHHPILFKPMQRLTTATPEGRTLLSLAKAGIAVYSAHTAFDNCADGINDLLAKTLGLQSVGPLRSADAESGCKIVVFVPDKDLAKVSDAMFAAGAGRIGEYRECSFRLSGVGTFFGGETTNPTVGERGQREDVSEWRLEVLCPDHRVRDVITAMRGAHSYEEPAYDVYPLRAEPGKLGEGRIGTLPAAMLLSQFAQSMKTALKAAFVQYIGGADRSVRKVALACGAAAEFLGDAIQQKADVFLTGEARFHDGLAAQAQQIALVLPGHYATERLGMEALAVRLQSQFPALQIWASRNEREPLATV
jgi:dinuclear metal center YbgI/SA1388 family protein